MNNQLVVKIVAVIALLVFAIFIFIGGGFVTDVLFNEKYDTSCVGINTDTKLNIAKLSIVMFWIVFIPLCLLPIALVFGYELF